MKRGFLKAPVGRLLVGIAAACLLFLVQQRSAHAGQVPEGFSEASRLLSSGDFNTAIDRLESLSDTGFVHPDASFNRGLAYLYRVRANAERPGDLGKAAASFEEARSLRGEDAAAEQLLDEIRSEIQKRRSRAARGSESARPTLDRMLVELASERTFAILSLLSSVLFAVGLLLRTTPRPVAHVTGSVLAPTALVCAFVFTPLSWGAHHLKATKTKAVVVVPEASWMDEASRPKALNPIPEGSLVETSERRGSLIRARWGSNEGWVQATSVRLLAR